MLACSIYVGLNPIRAGICETPEQSDRLSVDAGMGVSSVKNLRALVPLLRRPRNAHTHSTSHPDLLRGVAGLNLYFRSVNCLIAVHSAPMPDNSPNRTIDICRAAYNNTH